jgi:ornithine--oxo-acid transaminase
MVREVRGAGLMNGIVFQPPQQLRLRLSFEACKAIHPGMFGQMLVRRLFIEHDILSQICGNNFMVLKVAPPLVVTEAQIERYLGAIRATVEALHVSSGFWSDAMRIGSRALRV